MIRVELFTIEREQCHVLQGFYLPFFINISNTTAGYLIFFFLLGKKLRNVLVFPDHDVWVQPMLIGAIFMDEDQSLFLERGFWLVD